MNRVLASLLVLAAACGPDPEPAGPRVWSVVAEDLSTALLSVRVHGGFGYAVGADDGMGPAVYRREEAGWERLPTTGNGALWWVAADGSDLLMVGEGGLMFGHTPGTESFEAITTPTDKTLFGTWVAPNGDAWAVGGDVRSATDRGVLLTRTGGAWRVDERATADLYAEVALFKVWGRSDNDVWVVGEGGTFLRFDGSTWRAEDSGTSARLLTIHGSAEGGPYAVGGVSNGVILEWNGSAFVDKAPEFLPTYNGVYYVDESEAFAVGNFGLLSMRVDGEWWVEEAPVTTRDLHAVTVDGDGTAYAVGGALASPSLDRGVLLRFGVEP